MSAADSFRDLHDKLRAGDARAGEAIFGRYREQLVRLVAPKLRGMLRQKVDAEDIVQSAFRSFLRSEAKENFEIGGWSDLWSVLATITLRKCRRQVRTFLTAKRDLRRERAPDPDEAVGWQAVAAEPTPAESAEFTDLLERLFSSVDDRQRQIIEHSLNGLSPAEIGPHVGLTERSVYRQLHKIRERIDQFDVVEDAA